MRPLLMPSYLDMGRMESIIETSDLEWTIVRPPYLDPGIKKSKDYRLNDEVCVKGGWKIGRIDVAKFMVKEATDSEWVGKHPTIAV
jgi:putative NADH-flavin reductase